MKNLRRILAAEGLLKEAAPKTPKLVAVKLDGEVFQMTPEQKAALAAVPGGSGRYADHRRGVLNGLQWTKKGGLPDAILKKARDAAKAAGFKPGSSSTSGSPDGSWVGGKNVMQNKAGDTLRFSDTYGVTSSSNYFSVELKFADPKPFSIDPIREKERAEEAARVAVIQMAEAHLQAIPGVTDLHTHFMGVTGDLPVQMWPEWAIGQFRNPPKVSVDTHKSAVYVFADTKNPVAYYRVKSVFDPQDQSSLRGAVEDALAQFKALSPQAP